jgi:hypothetical protein
MRKTVLAVVIGVCIAGGVAIADDRPERSSLQAGLSARADSGGMMEGCREMMSGGRMGRSRRSAPNEQWGERR